MIEIKTTTAQDGEGTCKECKHIDDRNPNDNLGVIGRCLLRDKAVFVNRRCERFATADE